MLCNCLLQICKLTFRSNDYFLFFSKRTKKMKLYRQITLRYTNTAFQAFSDKFIIYIYNISRFLKKKNDYQKEIFNYFSYKYIKKIRSK